MLALAGVPLGHRFRFLDPAPDAPAAALGEVVPGSYDDLAVAREFARGLDVVTYEFENVPVRTAQELARDVAVYPPPVALELAQDRLTEKEGFRSLGIPTAPYRAVDSRDALDRAIGELGLPAVLKTRRLGYDGKGQAVLRVAGDADAAWERLGSVPLLLEGWVGFKRELSILGVRRDTGALRFYPLIETHHDEGILRLAYVPAADSVSLQLEAERYARALMDHLGYVGVLALELFDTGQGLLANEMAPRVHNSGHWSQDGAVVCQFENHIRAVCGMPLGSTKARGYATMVNLIGALPDQDAVLALDDAHLHLYDKAPRPGRKLGHINVQSADRDRAMSTTRAVRELLEREADGARVSSASALPQ